MSRIFGAIRQNGYVVTDIDAAMHHWTSKLGVGPFFYVERAPIEDFRYMGEPSECSCSIALANSGALQSTTSSCFPNLRCTSSCQAGSFLNTFVCA